jgi:hypothetical protein
MVGAPKVTLEVTLGRDPLMPPLGVISAVPLIEGEWPPLSELGVLDRDVLFPDIILELDVLFSEMLLGLDALLVDVILVADVLLLGLLPGVDVLLPGLLAAVDVLLIVIPPVVLALSDVEGEVEFVTAV